MLLKSETNQLIFDYWEYFDGLKKSNEWLEKLRKDPRKHAGNNTNTKEQWEDEVCDAQSFVMRYSEYVESAIDLFHKHGIPVPKEK